MTIGLLVTDPARRGAAIYK